MNAIDVFGRFVLKLFRRAPKPSPSLALQVESDPLAELRKALESQIEADERKRKRWGSHG